MSAKRKCAGCGALYDFEFGVTIICKYCGTKQNVSFNEDVYERIKQANNYRLNGEFKKSIDIYDTLLIEYPKSPELRFGKFLASYGVLDTDAFKDRKINFLEVINHTSVYDNEDYIEAIKYSVEQKAEYEFFGKTIEKIRIKADNLCNAIKANGYLAMIFSNGNAFENQFSQQIYNEICKNVDLFYSNVTILSEDKNEKESSELIAASIINSLYVVVEDYSKIDQFTLKIIDRFKRFQKKSNICLIVKNIDDGEKLKEFGNVIKIEDGCANKVLDDIILTSPLSFNDKFAFKKTRVKLNDNSNPSPKINVEEKYDL